MTITSAMMRPPGLSGHPRCHCRARRARRLCRKSLSMPSAVAVLVSKNIYHKQL